MIKKEPYGKTLKDQLLAGAKDRLYNFLLANGAIRGVIMNGTRMVNEMRANHELGVLETLVLGRAYLGVALMSADLKSADRLTIRINCSGPIKGKVALEYGNIAQDLANYYLISEQIPTAFNLSIKFDRDGHVTGAGGLFLQVMPGAGKELTMDLEDRVKNLPSLGNIFTEDKDPESLVRGAFQKHAPRFLSNRRIEFMCHCNKERLRSYLTLLPNN